MVLLQTRAYVVNQTGKACFFKIIPICILQKHNTKSRLNSVSATIDLIQLRFSLNLIYCTYIIIYYYYFQKSNV